MNCLIIKLGATGDVVRTTPLLRQLKGEISWVTAEKNAVLLQNLPNGNSLSCVSWENRERLKNRKFDLAINLEDTLEAASFLQSVDHGQLFGAYADSSGSLRYTADSRQWFDMSLISAYGKEKADGLKLTNRRTYQEMIFEGLGLRFTGERYLLPESAVSDLTGDVAIAAEAGPVWPMKNWAHYGRLQAELEALGLTVHILPRRPSLLEHLADVSNHRCLVGGDSLPMHFALGTGTPCVTLFNCTSPWEIHDYGVQTKIVSPLLEKFFYRRDNDPSASTAIGFDEVMQAALHLLKASPPSAIASAQP